MGKWVYLFSEGHGGMRDLLGGKGAGLAEMTRAEIPVPPGFTISTAACKAFFDAGRRPPDGLWEESIRSNAVRFSARRMVKAYLRNDHCHVLTRT